MLTGNHLVGGGHDGAGFNGVQQTQRLVHLGRRSFNLRQGTNDFARLELAGDIEILQGPLGLRAPEPVSWHFNRPKSVALGTGFHGRPELAGETGLQYQPNSEIVFPPANGQ